MATGIKSTYTVLKSFINSSEIGSEISRYRMQCVFRKEFQQTMSMNAVDSYKSYFLKLGFIKATKVKGFYTVVKHLPEDLTATELRSMYNEATGYTDKQITKFKKSVSNAEYLEIKYKPTQFIVLHGLSYIQGAITLCLVDFTATKSVGAIMRALSYAEIADFLNHKHKPISTLSSTVDRFCEINSFDFDCTNIFKKALLSNWSVVIEECKSLIMKQNEQ